MLDYDPCTGVFIWKDSPARRCRKGQKAGSMNADGYHQITVAGRTYAAHRLAWLKVYGDWPCHQIDHINAIPSDNRISNLRIATSSQNMHNPLRKKSKGKSSKYIGVSFDKDRQMWSAQIGLNNKKIKLGFFAKEEDAHEAYKARKKLIVDMLIGKSCDPQQESM